MSAGRAVLIFCAVTVLGMPSAFAQDSTSGAVHGVILDKVNGNKPLNGVLVVATSPNLLEAQSAMTSGKGQYRITNLPPGKYLVKFYFSTVSLTFTDVVVRINHTTSVFGALDLSKAGTKYINHGKAPPVDTRSSVLTTVITRNYLDHIPLPSRTVDGATGVVAGSANDGLGTGMSGSTSLENRIVLDGVDVTGITYGNVGATVINDFVQQVEVLSGGYNAEHGRSTGGITNVVTKSGTNQFHGGVFTYITPGFLTADRKRSPTESSSIDAEANLAYTADIGFDLGGPIIKDKLWFYVGFAPSFTRTNIDKITKRRTDCRILQANGRLSDCRPLEFGDGVPDEDPDSGFLIYEELDRRRLHSSSTNYYLVSKLNFAAGPSHQGQVSLLATPSAGESVGVRGDPAAISFKTERITTDLAAKWTSKLNNNKTNLEFIVGWHHSSITSGSVNPAADSLPRQNLYFGTLGTWAKMGFESQATHDGCQDSAAAGDPYPFIDNCPDEGLGYAIGGPGGLLDTTEDRFSAKLSGTQRIEFLGNHEIKAGIDVEDNRLNNVRHISGGAIYDVELSPVNRVTETRWVQLGAIPGGEFNETCRDDNSDTDHPCRFLGRSPVKGQTLNWSAYLRDSWQPKPNLTLSYGMRYEEQRLRYAEHLQDSLDPLTGALLGKNAMKMDGMWAPRAGFAYDWSKVGRSKIFGHWGRFYESIPMDINNRSFGGETLYRRVWDGASQCGATNPNHGGPEGPNCGANGERPVNGETVFGSGVLVAPGVRPQFMDELLLGVEYALKYDIKLGATLQYRNMGRVLEDVSVDNAETYILANPGEWSIEEERKLQAQIDREADVDERARLQGQLEQFRRIRTFDKPRRDYMALHLTASKRFNKRIFAQASYTYSRTEGNFPGLFSADNGQVDPNITSQYDLIELLANRDGPLPQDRPHYFKVDGFYRLDLGRAGIVTTGVRFRALSGTPVSALARHYLYGRRESFVLPRGAIGRSDFDYGLDLRLSYTRRLAHGMSLEVFTNLFNVFNRQGTFRVSQEYTRDSINPIVGGDYEDLVFGKAQSSSGGETSNPIRRDRNFGNTTVRYAPLSMRLGARLRF